MSVGLILTGGMIIFFLAGSIVVNFFLPGEG